MCINVHRTQLHKTFMDCICLELHKHIKKDTLSLPLTNSIKNSPFFSFSIEAEVFLNVYVVWYANYNP